MELKNQILLVILIPILLILSLAIIQVGVLGFITIPTFATSLLEFHINRHIDGINIEMSILSQEIFIQNQAFYNQLLGIAAHLRYYSFGDYVYLNNWEFNELNIPNQNFIYAINNNATLGNRTLDWFHPDYSNLEQLLLHDNITHQLLNKTVHSLHLGDLLININPAEMNNHKVKYEVPENFTIYSEDEVSGYDINIAIEYEFMQVICSNGMQIRYPAYTDFQLQMIKDQFPQTGHGKDQKNMSFNSTIFEGTNIQSQYPGDVLNFTLNIAQSNTFNGQTYGINLQQVISTFKLHGDQQKVTTCAFNIKILNNYFTNLTQSDSFEHNNQLEHQHSLFIALNDNNLTTISPANYSNLSLASAIFTHFVSKNYPDQSQQQSIINSPNNNIVQTISDNLTELVQNITNQRYNLTNITYYNNFSVEYDGYEIYVLMTTKEMKSDKSFSSLIDPSSNISYLHIAPQTNNYSLNTFIIVHTFEKNALISDLYQDTSLGLIKTLEIIVFVVIIVLSIIIFIFVWFTATRIGQSFEQPIRVLTEFMNSIDIQNMEQEEELMGYEEYFNSFEIRALFKTMNIFVTTIKYSNQKYSNSKHSDAIALMELSKAKDFYKKEIGNMSAVGICANNIGVLHMKGQRVFEAVNEMEEAIFIAKQELQEIKELKKWCVKMNQSYQEPNFYSNFRAMVNGVANKFRQLEFNWNNKLQKSGSVSKALAKSSRNTLNSRAGGGRVISNLTKNYSINQLNTKNGMPQFTLLGNKHTPMLSGNQTVNNSINPPSPFNHRQKDKSKRDKKQQYDVQELQSIDQDQMSHPSPQHINKPFFANNSQINHSSLIQSQRVDLKESILSDIKRRNSPQNDDNLYKNNQTEMEMLAEKLIELKKKKQLGRAKLQNRQFQLAQFMFNICMHYSDVFIPETLSLFEQFESVSDKNQKSNSSKMVRMINLYIKKALCYIQIGDIQKFKVEEGRAEEMYNLLTSENNLQDCSRYDELDFNFVDMFKNVPHEVLYSKILQLKAIYALLKGNFRTSAQLLSEIIQSGEYYDPEVRDFSLVLLENIFKLFNLPTAPIKQFQSHIAINVYEIVMMIDYSKNMSVEQINLSHSICTSIFSIIQPQDLVGLYGFNNSLHEAFPLQPKGTYKDLLQKQIFMAITAPGGDSKLYQALKYAVKNFFENRIDFQSKVVQDLSYHKAQNERDTVISPSTQKKSEKMKEKVVNHDTQRRVSEEKSKTKLKLDSSDSDDEVEVNNSNDSNKNQYDDRTRYKYICLFTEINKHLTVNQQLKLQRLLTDNQVDLLVFNIANQNANMLDLKELSKITPKSIFVHANASLDNIFGKSRQNQLQKKMYLEFF